MATTSEDLDRNVLPLPSVVAQSVGAIAPTASLAVLVALVFATAGNGTWLSFVLATIAMVFVGVAVGAMARRISTPGSFYAYAARALGPTGGFLAGGSLLIAYLTVPVVSLGVFVVYSLGFLSAIGIDIAQGWLTWTVAAGVGGLIAGILVYRSVSISTLAITGLEAVSLSIVAAIFIAAFIHHGGITDSDQLRLSHATFHGIGKGMLLSIFGLAGFESAAVLGREARDPFRAVPRAVLGSTVVMGLAYVVAAYVIVFAFAHSGLSLATSANSLTDVAHIAGVRALDAPLDLGIVFSALGGAIGSMNGASRMLMTMSRDGVVPVRRLGIVHRVHKTPYVALGFALGITLLAMFLFFVTGTQPLTALGYYATVSTFGFAGGYLMICIAAPVFVHRTGHLSPALAVASTLGAAGTIGVIWVTVYPVPPSPYNLFPYIYLGLMLAVLARLVALRLRHSPVLSRIGLSLEEEDAPAALSADAALMATEAGRVG